MSRQWAKDWEPLPSIKAAEVGGKPGKLWAMALMAGDYF